MTHTKRRSVFWHGVCVCCVKNANQLLYKKRAACYTTLYNLPTKNTVTYRDSCISHINHLPVKIDADKGTDKLSGKRPDLSITNNLELVEFCAVCLLSPDSNQATYKVVRNL
jgi:hypothetical protein